jgi:cell shape-determining protein MreD
MGTTLVVPLTIIPVFIFFIYGLKVPAISILCLGIIDDVLSNAVLGTFAFLYSVIAYFLSIKGRKFDRPKLYICITITLYTALNILFPS